MLEEPASTSITSGASQSLTNTSSGPPHDTVASRPRGYREIQNSCGVCAVSASPDMNAAL